ncbi:fasciclin-like arabinogalactan protein 14 [Actinidia eriantha]|uniref:fasciclin-like arabinogalactan protein 14 n=1 Tax=Actinidia eriantha TaxID=165200 RepID=UPI00258F10A5|nr:fasciclin-like arabinogalactan protein 14 [Actinidia eriantha]
MNSKVSLLLSLFLLSYAANAFNITRLLGQYPDFSTFNDYLTQTQLVAAINSRQTITVLAVDNTAASALSGKPADALKKIMSAHVVLDFYDVAKLQKLPNKTAVLTTLFQASGQAAGQQGFLNVTDLSSGSVAFGSAVHGSTLSANLVKSVASQPYNISVLQISSVIIPTGIGGSTANSSSNSTASPQVSPAPSPRKSKLSPAPTPVESTATPSPTPAKSPTTAPTPATAPPQPSEAPAPSKAPADAPAADTPIPAEVPGSPPSPADGPTADGPSADVPTAESPSAGVALRLSLCAGIVIVLSTFSLVLMT